jgi:putative transposase
LYGRTGTLWEGRYKATIVDSDEYLLTCMRYIELNPVRAGMTAAPHQYRWSSYHANATGARDELVVPHDAYLRLGSSPAERRAAYRELARETIPTEALGKIRDATEHGWALGSATFRHDVGVLSRRADRLPLGRPRRIELTRKVDSDPTSRKVDSDPTLGV